MANETEQGRYRGQSSRSPNGDGNDAGGMRDDESGDRRNRRRDYDEHRPSQGRESRHGGSEDYPQERRGDDWQRRTGQQRPYSGGGAEGSQPESWGGDGQGFGGSQYGEQGDRSPMQHGQRGSSQSGYGQPQSGEDWYGGQQPYANQQQHDQRGSDHGRYGENLYGQRDSHATGFGGSGMAGMGLPGAGPTDRHGRAGVGQGYSQGSSPGQSQHRQHGRGMGAEDEINDPDYHEWRHGQMKSFDDDYRSWRGEKQKKFSEEFDNYRKNRDRSSASGDESKYGKSTTPKSSS